MTDAEINYLWQRRYDIKVRSLMNRIYYQERQRIFEARDGFIKAASIAAGSIALAKLSSPEIMQLCAAFITIVSTLSLVFGYGAKARESVKLAAEWTQLERDIELVGERAFDENHLNQWAARCNEIEAGEPPAHPLLLLRCNHRAVQIIGGTMEGKPTFWQRHAPTLLIP